MPDINSIIDYSQHLKVLYVEDNHDVKESTVVLLKLFFNTIITASNGCEGIEKFKQNSIDLVITDINMPQMDGLTMAQELKNSDPDIPILIFSAYNDSNYFLEAIKIGVEGYLLKPIDIEQFQQSLAKTVHDIKIKREHKAYQENLKAKIIQKDKMLLEQSKHAAMGEMIDIIAHQWKQPLNSIVMHASMIEDSLDSMDKEVLENEFKECYSNLNIQVDYLLSTLNEFRTFLRPNNKLEKVTLKSIIDSTLVLLKDDLMSQQIKVTLECDSQLALEVYPNDIKQLLINIITNAKEEMINNNVAFDAREIIIRCFQNSDKIVLQIKNSGSVIDEAIIEDIFTMNFTTKEQNGGTGIGLYMCSLICKKYNANIKAYNDDYAVFEITF